jgi:hypothetical protein
MIAVPLKPRAPGAAGLPAMRFGTGDTLSLRRLTPKLPNACSITKVQLLDLYFRYLARTTGSFHTAFTYHRTWETGLEEVTRVSSSNPHFLR